ncbi:MAG TPA: hypothetical protein DEO70_07270 [Bacteroidales bacterium]|nr:MAG: hypothetical protein A2X11_06890 [Bacteroidetes bacterium GWE2_42_24]OFY25970.1 MAG: hypothetical protein A2X09_04705 [Bacteroidetes bacterium GWF2_43_11]HBZ66621.1 hypothetical protein [Bacteroidales bacterium]
MAESIFKIKVSNGLINIELEGKSEIVIEQFNEIRRTGLEKFLTGGVSTKPAPKAAAPKVVETPSIEPINVAEPKKRGRTAKKELPARVSFLAAEAITAKKDKKKSLVVANPEKIKVKATLKKEKPLKTKSVAEVKNDVIGTEAIKTKIKAPKAPVAKKEPKLKKEPVKARVKEEKAVAVKLVKEKQPKAPKVRAPKSKETPVDVNLNLLPSLSEVCSTNRPGPEREWILIYALYASDFGKRTISRDDIVLKYEETGRKDQSKINNLTNNIANAIKKGWIDNPESKRFYITPVGITMAYTIATRTAPIKIKKTGKVPKKPKAIAEPKIEVMPEVKVENEPTLIPIHETALQVAKKAKKAKSKSVKKAKSKKKPVRKAPVKKEESAKETAVEQKPESIA